MCNLARERVSRHRARANLYKRSCGYRADVRRLLDERAEFDTRLVYRKPRPFECWRWKHHRSDGEQG